MRSEGFDGVESPLELLLGKERVDLLVTWRAEAHGLAHQFPVELAFVVLVVMPCARDEVMARQLFLSFTKGAQSGHFYRNDMATALIFELCVLEFE